MICATLAGLAFTAVCVLCWALLRQQRTMVEFLQDPKDWGVQ